MVGELISQVEIDLGNHGELVLFVGANVGDLSQQAPLQNLCRWVRRVVDGGLPDDPHGLACIPNRHFDAGTAGPIASSDSIPQTHVEAVELISNIKVVNDVKRPRIVGIAAGQVFGDGDTFLQLQVTITNHSFGAGAEVFGAAAEQPTAAAFGATSQSLEVKAATIQLALCLCGDRAAQNARIGHQLRSLRGPVEC